MLPKIIKKVKSSNPVTRLAKAYRRWKATRKFYRLTRDDSGREYLYEFTFVPRDEIDRWSMLISCVDYSNQRVALVERSVSDSEMKRLAANMIEI